MTEAEKELSELGYIFKNGVFWKEKEYYIEITLDIDTKYEEVRKFDCFSCTGLTFKEIKAIAKYLEEKGL